MSHPPASDHFQFPKVRQVFITWLAPWLGLVIVVAIAPSLPGLDIEVFADPVFTPLLYVVLFGSSSLWIVRRYRQRQIDLKQLLGPLPQPLPWRQIFGIWLVLFIFSIGAFQVSFGLLSYIFPTTIEATLSDSIFLDQPQTALPWLHNGLMLGLLVIAAPILEGFLFRAFFSIVGAIVGT